jgi:AcrR family transcriptional regulator
MGLKERREREKELRKKQILKAGTKVFLKKGLESSTIQDIAQTAELGRATIYYYYPSKKNILRDILIKGLDNFFEKLLNDLRKAKNEIDVIERIIYFYINFLKRKTSYAQICCLVVASTQIPWVKNVVEDFQKAYNNWYEKLKETINKHTNKRNTEKIAKLIPVFARGLAFEYLLSKDMDKVYKIAKEFLKNYKS